MDSPWKVRCVFFAMALGWAVLPLAAASPYTLGSGDSIDVKVAGEAALSGAFKVSPEGTIVYPLLGSLSVTGRTITAVASLLRERLGKDYLVSPEVAVYVAEYGSKKVAILGDIPKSGWYVLKDDSTLLSLLSEAGLKLAEGDAVIIITRAGDSGPEKRGREAMAPVTYKLERLLNPWQDQPPVELSDGDRIFVKSGSEGKVIMSGKVKTPGVIPLTDGMTAMEAINKAGGLADFGSLDGVRIVRDDPKGSEVIKLNLQAVMDGDRSKDLELKAGDIVVVPRRWF